MEQRKLMSLGKSSLVITMPRDWVNRNNLRKGNYVSLLTREDGTLLVHPWRVMDDVKKEIHLLVSKIESEGSITRRIIASYLDGYDVIKLTSEEIFTANQQKTIREIISTLYMMIIDSAANSIVLETLIDDSQVSVLTRIERMHIITYSMCEDILNSMDDWSKDVLESLLPLEKDIDQLMFLLLRSIRSSATNPSLLSKLELSVIDCLDFQTLVHRIERIADHNTTISENLITLIESGVSLPGRVINTLTKGAEVAFSSYKLAIESFLERNINPTNGIINSEHKINELFMEVTPLNIDIEANQLSIISCIINIRESIRKVAHYAADIAELTIDRTYVQVN